MFYAMLTAVWRSIGERYGPHQNDNHVKWYLATQVILSAAHIYDIYIYISLQTQEIEMWMTVDQICLRQNSVFQLLPNSLKLHFWGNHDQLGLNIRHATC